MSYYTVIAGWVLAYAWKCVSGELNALPRRAVETQFHDFLSNPWRVGVWHLAFVVLLGGICARGVNRGIEVANKIRAPALLILLLVLAAYALATGDLKQGHAFAFAPDFSRLSANVVLAAIGQAFFATGVGMGMMLAYGAYVPRGASLVRAALIISGSIVLVSLLATLMIFPLMFRYGLNPAQGAELVFNVLPVAFWEMPGGRIVGSLFFIFLILAALTPSLAGHGTHGWRGWLSGGECRAPDNRRAANPPKEGRRVLEVRWLQPVTSWDLRDSRSPSAA